MRTANPALSDKTFDQVVASDQAMTIEGTINKTFLSLFLLVGGAMYTWKMYFATMTPEGIGDTASVMPWMIGGGIGGFIVAIITVFKKTWAPFTTPIYAILEGLLLGGLSAFIESMYPGIVLQAVALTFGTLFSLLWVATHQRVHQGLFSTTRTGTRPRYPLVHPVGCSGHPRALIAASTHPVRTRGDIVKTDDDVLQLGKIRVPGEGA